jgi:hypothetical protein
MAHELTTTEVRPDNPAELGYPPTLPVEVALRTASIRRICEAYHLTREDWDALRQDPRFVADVAAAVEMLRREGMSFKMKARLQSEELLRTSWRMIHAPSDEVPPSVRADLLKFTIRVAGLDASAAAATNAAQANNTLQIQINLG